LIHRNYGLKLNKNFFVEHSCYSHFISRYFILNLLNKKLCQQSECGEFSPHFLFWGQKYFARADGEKNVNLR
ncbi:hypothetical protein, partial [Actinobacillus porcinus]|uniref:hypothetical protein n=1 Tax=Actinobacillus porcinus TaxID=51048 RepID=UPI001AF00E36